tara:strand:+ start:48904 stop:49203 length:300 start_codon:yes stop_codon:yes gene_type:complete
LKADKLLLELEHLLEQSGYTLRKERGSFRGSDCIIEGDKIVMVNKNKPVESQIGTIVSVLGEIDLSEVYIKPVIRKELVRLWDQMQISPVTAANSWEQE